MNPFERLSDNCTNTQQQRSLCGPVARRARTVLLTRDDDERNAVLLVLHRPVVNRDSLGAGSGGCPAAFGSRSELVAKANVRERSAHHHLVISTACTVRVELGRLHAVRNQPLSCRTCCRNRARRRDVVGRYRVTEHRERSSSRDRANAGRSQSHSVEERRILHVR